jgi:hypothetical protein
VLVVCGPLSAKQSRAMVLSSSRQMASLPEIFPPPRDRDSVRPEYCLGQPKWFVVKELWIYARQNAAQGPLYLKWVYSALICESAWWTASVTVAENTRLHLT